MGAQRRAHHAAVAAERQAGIEATRMRIEQEQAEQRMREMAEALKAQQALAQAPTRQPLATTLGETGGGVRTARTARSTTAGLARGVAALRIPLNVGGTSGSGLNIG